MTTEKTMTNDEIRIKNARHNAQWGLRGLWRKCVANATLINCPEKTPSFVIPASSFLIVFLSSFWLRHSSLTVTTGRR